MHIASVTTVYPEATNPWTGLSVQQRINALSRHTPLKILHVRPWFPFLQPLDRRDLESRLGKYPPIARLPMLRWPRLSRDRESARLQQVVHPALLILEGQRRLQVIDAQMGYPQGVGSVQAGQAMNLPVFLTLHGPEVRTLEHPIRGPQLLDALRQCAGVVCVAHCLRDCIVARGIPADKVRVLPNAVQRETFHPGSRAEAKRQLKLVPGQRLLVSVGRFESDKRQHLLLQVFQLLREGCPDLRLALIGELTRHEPHYLASIVRMIARMNLTEAVYLPGSLPPERVAVWLRAAELFVSASVLEGCSTAILEALASGVPVVATPAGDNEALLDPPHRGVVPKSDEPAGLVSAIRMALKDRWDRELIARYQAEHTWEEVGRRTLDFYRERLEALGLSKALASPTEQAGGVPS